MIDLSSKICQKQRHEDRHHTVWWQAGHSATQAWKALNKALQAAPVCGPSRTICAGDPRSCPLYAFRAWSPWAALWCHSARPSPKGWSHCWQPPKAPRTWSCSRLMEGGGGGRRSDSKAGSTENAATGARGLGLFRRGPGVVTFEWGVVGFRPSFFCGLFRISVLLLPSSSGG